MSRNGLLLITILALQVQGLAEDLDSVQVTLALKDGKTTYRTGEAIVLDLSFTANEPGRTINTTTTEPASPIDEITISPADGVFSWLEDSSRGHKYAPDYAGLAKLSPDTPLHILLPLNAVYRIDKPGHYTVRVTTHRVLSGEPVAWGAAAVTTNDISFDVEAMSEADEQTLVTKLVNEIRNAPDLKSTGDPIYALQYLSGDTSTRAKVDLYLHPKVFEPFGTDVTQGLWMARNRALVVTLLEQAMKDPSLPVSNIANLTAQIKATIVVPPGPNAAVETERVQRETKVGYLREIAATLSGRTGENLTQTATTLLTQLAEASQTETPEFAAAREALITHFGEVTPWHVDGLLNSYGKYLSDPRLVPSLKAFLREHQPPIFSSSRDAVLNQLLILAPPGEAEPFVVDAVCDPESAMRFDALAKLPVETLLEADQCLLKQIQWLGRLGERSAQIELEQKTMLAARFATKAIYQPMLAIYKQYGSKWLDDARGGMLAYLARYDAKGGLELLKQGIKLGSGQPMNAAMSLCQSFYSPTVNRFFEGELQREDDTLAVSWSAYQLSQQGPAKDQAVIRARLDRWRKKWAAQGEKLAPNQGRLQADLILAVISGKNWQMDETEARSLKESCVSDACRDRARRSENVSQTAP